MCNYLANEIRWIIVVNWWWMLVSC